MKTLESTIRKAERRYFKYLGQMMQLGIANATSIDEVNALAKQLVEYGKYCPKTSKKYIEATLELQELMKENQ